MKETAITIAVVTTLLTHYVFSFQRFTLAIARRHASVLSEVPKLQMMMTPTLMGAAGWGSHLLSVVAAILLGVAFSWWVGLVFLLVEFFLTSWILPLFQLKGHFAGMARRVLQNHVYGPTADVAAALMTDVNRAEEGRRF